MILNVNSQTGLYVPGPIMGGYSASKHAGRAISEVMRLEVPEHVQVGVIYSGLVQSELGGSPEMTSIGMPTDEFVNIIWPQIENGEFHIVSHPWAKDYAAENAAEIDRTFDRYAPHFEGDRKYDSKRLASQTLGQSCQQNKKASIAGAPPCELTARRHLSKRTNSNEGDKKISPPRPARAVPHVECRAGLCSATGF